MVHDHPGFGASDVAVGKPRQEIDPWEQVRGLQDAITFAQSRPEVDAARIGVWGSSYAGAHAYVVAAIDRRVKAVCGQVPLISGRRNFETLVRVDFWEATWQMLAADRLARAGGEDPIVDRREREPLAPSALPTADSYEWFTRTAAKGSLVRNEVTFRSLEIFRGYEPGEYLRRISPTPLLMIVAPLDRLAPGESPWPRTRPLLPQEARPRARRALRRLHRGEVRHLVGSGPGLVRRAPARRVGSNRVRA